MIKKMKTLFITMFFVLACVAAEAVELRRFEPPVTVDDASMPVIEKNYPWIRACCSEWMPWAFTFEEWKSYRSKKLTDGQKMDAAKFKSYQQAVAAQVPRWHSILAVLSLSQDDEDFLVVVSYPEKLDRYPSLKSDLKFAFGLLLFRKSNASWRLVDIGTDIASDSPVVKEMLAIDFAALVIPTKKPEPNRG